MRTKTKTLIFAVTAALLVSGSALAQRPPPMGINAPPVPPVGPLLPGVTCTGSGGTNCNVTAPPDFDSTITIANCATIRDVEVGADVSAFFSGDIELTLTSPGGGASVLIVQGGAGGGCPTPDMYTVLDDDSGVLVSTFCAAIPPGIDGVLKPSQPLTAFDGQNGNGAWTLGVHDDFALFDDITLNDWSLSLVCDDDADLAIAKTAPATVSAGTQMTYSIVADNDGPAGVTDMVVVDTLPAGTSYVSDTSGGLCAPAGQILTCNIGAVPGNGDFLFDVTVLVGAGVANGTVLTNSVEISSALVNDTRTANNTDTADTLVAAVAPITVIKTQTTPDPIVAGSGANNLCYNINVANAGPSNVSGLDVMDSYTAWTGVTPASGSWPNQSIGAGLSINIPFCLTVGSSAPEGNLTNTASIDPASGNGADLGNPANHSSSVVTAITRVATLTLDKTGPANVTAGSGAGNLSYTVTVVNNGPSDVSGLTVNDVITGPASGGLINVSGTGNQVATVAAGGTWAFNVTGTVALAAVEGETITNTATVTGSGGGEAINNPTDNVVTTIAWPTATFNVTKLYNGGTGASVPVALVCSDGTNLGFGAPGNGNTDTALVWRRFDHPTGTTCSVVETVPPGYYEAQRTLGCDVAAVADGATYDCTLTNLETVARFHVTKDFSDGSTDDVDVTLSCDTGLPLTQMLTIAGGDPTGVTFVVKDFIDGTMSCAVTEVTNTPGYDIDDTTCKWPLVNSINGPFGCVVNNTAQDASFTASVVWNVINEGGDAVDTTNPVTIYCDREITTSNGTIAGSKRSASKIVGDGGYLDVTVDTLTGPADCYATQSITASGVESIDDCGSSSYPFTLTAGSSDSCTFENTVFFEGIPTLSQYGLAILALLTLGLGMVGFRRFV